MLTIVHYNTVYSNAMYINVPKTDLTTIPNGES